MTIKERERCYKIIASFSDKELAEEYYNEVLKDLGSEAEIMEERGYDIVDIKERYNYERWHSEYVSMLEECCKKRDIKLWGETKENKNEKSNNA